MSPTVRRAREPDVDSHGSDRDRDDVAGVTGQIVTGPVIGFDPEELVGFRIGVTAHRRSADLIAALERRGAEVLHAPTLRIVPADQDERLITATAQVIAARPDVLLVTTAYGLRGWLEAADAAGLGAPLLEVLGESRILVRGPKARGAVRAGGLRDAGMSDEETTASLVDQVLADGAAGQTIAIQLHGFVDEEQLIRLRAGRGDGDHGGAIPVDCADRAAAGRSAARRDRRPDAGRGHLHQRTGRRGAAGRGP